MPIVIGCGETRRGAMSNVVNMGGKQASSAMLPNVKVIEALQQLLDDAKSGQVQHIIAIASDGRSMPFDMYVGSGEQEQVMMLVGSMELCKHTMLAHMHHESADYTTTS